MECMIASTTLYPFTDIVHLLHTTHALFNAYTKGLITFLLDLPPLVAQFYAESGAKFKSDEPIKQAWNVRRRQDRRWLHDLVKRRDELAPNEREIQAFTRISQLSTPMQMHDALESDDILPKVKHLYIILLHERREATNMLQLSDTDPVKDWWSMDKAWTLGGDLPEEGARHVAREAWDKQPEEEAAAGLDELNLNAMIPCHGFEEMSNMQLAGPLLPPDFKDLERSGVNVAEWDETVAGGSDYESEEVDLGEETTEESIQKFEEGSEAREEGLGAKIERWDAGEGSVGTEENWQIWSEEETELTEAGDEGKEDNGDTRGEEEETHLAREPFMGWRFLEPGEVVRWEQPKTPESINYDS